jgi:hypothetical protein
MLFELDVDVPEDRRLVLELPPEVPTGPQRLTLNPIQEKSVARHRGIHPSMVPEHQAFLRMLPDLLRDYPEQYAAIKDGKVVVIAATEQEAIRRSSELVPGIAYVGQITLAPKVERLPSIRERR